MKGGEIAVIGQLNISMSDTKMRSNPLQKQNKIKKSELLTKVLLREKKKNISKVARRFPFFSN